ncbi:MAG: methionine biosynthesis protein MetW [Candidatus Omnitrophota bacterium]
MNYDSIKLDHRIILDFVEPRTSVLDLGCGTGELLYLLIKEKNVRGQGIEIDEQAIYKCVEKGLNVIHGDIDSGLTDYRDKSFDYVILNQSIQQVRYLKQVLSESLRVGKKVIVGFPNFAYLKARSQLFFKGRVPVTPSLPYPWYETPNLHFFSISDFLDHCRKNNIKIEHKAFITEFRRILLLPNLLAQSGILVLSK